MRTRTTTITALTAAALLALTACSSGSDDTASGSDTAKADKPAAPQTADDAAALEKAVRDYTAALFSGDESGYRFVSARCRKQMDKPEWVGMAESAHQQYGAQKATDVRVDQMAGDLARVSYGAGQIPQFEREGQSWTREGGTWRWDACPATG